MNIYLVSRAHREARPGELDSVVVIAASEGDARIVVSMNCGDEDPNIWLMSYSTVQLVGVANPGYLGKPVVCRNFRAS